MNQPNSNTNKAESACECGHPATAHRQAHHYKCDRCNCDHYIAPVRAVLNLADKSELNNCPTCKGSGTQPNPNAGPRSGVAMCLGCYGSGKATPTDTSAAEPENVFGSDRTYDYEASKTAITRNIKRRKAPQPELTAESAEQLLNQYYWGKDWLGEYPDLDSPKVTDEQRAELMELQALIATAKADSFKEGRAYAKEHPND